MPVNSDLTEAQVREFGSGPGGQRAATQGAKQPSSPRDRRHLAADADHNLQRGIEPCRD